MNNNLPDISYERNMNHNYMILRSCEFFESAQNDKSDFRKKMVLENNIPGLLPVRQRIIQGEVRYYYEINSFQSIDRIYSKKEICYEELKHILMGCVKLFESLEEYLLDGSQIILRPEYIYMNLDNYKILFTCYPGYDGNVREAFKDFMDMLLTKIDHTDNDAVMLSYKVYRYTKNPNYVMGEIAHIIESTMPKYEEPIISQAQPVLENNFYFEENSDNISEDNGSRRRDKKFKKLEFKKQELQKSKDYNKGDNKSTESKGKIICLLIALAAILLILSGIAPDMEIYLNGAVAMSLVGTILFAISDAKKKKQAKEKAALTSDENEGNEFMMPVNPIPIPITNTNLNFKSVPIEEEDEGTAFLGEDALEERILIGRVNGQDVTIPLTKFPATLGKHVGISDIIVDDKAVSKMHARFDERGGKIYLSDLNSTNGTIRNGKMLDINSPVALEVGDRLRFGRSCFTYC